MLADVLYLDLASAIIDCVEQPPSTRKALVLMVAPSVLPRDLPLDVFAGLGVCAIVRRMGAEFLLNLRPKVRRKTLPSGTDL